MGRRRSQEARWGLLLDEVLRILAKWPTPTADLKGRRAHRALARLSGRPRAPAIIATVRADGRPHPAPAPPFAFVIVEGMAELSDDLEGVRRWAARIGGRYMGVDRADEHGSRNAVPGELLVRITLVHVVAKKNVVD